MILTRAQALKASKRTFTVLTVPELDGELRLGSLSAGAALRANDLMQRQAEGERVDREMVLLLFSSSVVDEAGKPLFDEAAAGEFIEAISSETLALIVGAINGLKPPAPAVSPGNSLASPAGA